MKRIVLLISILFAVFVAQAQITADFTWSDPQCSEGTIMFADASTGTAVTSWEWRVDGLLLGNSSTFTHTFPQVLTPTDFDISLYVSGAPYSDNVTYVVTIYPLPTVAIAPIDPTICEGEIATLTASGADTYVWSTTETINPITPTMWVQTTYTVTGTDVNQCVNTANTTVYVNLIDTTLTTDEFCEDNTYDFFGTPLTAPGVYYYTTPSLVTGCDSVTELTLSMNLIDTTIINDEFCQGDIYSFFGTDLTTSGTHFHTLTSVITGCDSVIQLELVENPIYLIQETEYICSGDIYNWQGTDYNTAGIHYANYTTTSGCDSIYELELIVHPVFDFTDIEEICDGDSVEWRGSWYDATGIYTEPYSTVVTGCDSIYTLDLTVNDLPQLYTVITDPIDGLLTGGATGEIMLSWSDDDTEYWTTTGTAIYTGAVTGTNSVFSLDDTYAPGTYEVWSVDTATGCVLKQGTVMFTDDLGIPKIVGSASYGPSELSFVDNAVEMSLYESTVDIYGDPVIIPQGAAQAVVGGNTEFDNLVAGDYYLKSVVVDTAAYPNVMPVWFYDGMSVDSADIITLGATYILSVNINHPMMDDTTGTNTIGGTIDTIAGGTKSSVGANMVVILRNEITGELIAVDITDANGEFFFDNVPDNLDVEVYVTSFAHPNWEAVGVSTTTNTHYEVNFVLDGDSVHEMSAVDDVGLAKLDFTIYPNPASNSISFDGIPINAELKIMDMTGKVVILDTRSNKSNLDVSSLMSSAYVVVIATKDGVGIQKLIINK